MARWMRRTCDAQARLFDLHSGAPTVRRHAGELLWPLQPLQYHRSMVRVIRDPEMKAIALSPRSSHINPARMVLVSNRVQCATDVPSGGLAVALQAMLSRGGGLWFGWSGVVCDQPKTHHSRGDGVDYVTLDLSQRDYSDYYLNFANRLLWPLLHSRPDLVDVDRRSFAGYQRVNQKLAAALRSQLQPADTVWIHDYHLIPLASMLRAAGVDQRIGFFLHVPFPPFDVLSEVLEQEDCFAGLADYDVVGFQTSVDLDNFLDYMRLSHGSSVSTVENAGTELREVQTRGGRRFRAGVFPISIDTAAVVDQSAISTKNGSAARLVANSAPLILGVDRLDYSKGIPERFGSYGKFLERNPSFRGNVDFLQIAPISRGEIVEYQALRLELEQISERINARYSSPGWMPLRYVNRNLDSFTLAGLYRRAAVGLVTPLRDGMNLVAKEYVACQNPDNPGVLVLSHFAGAARELTDALLVDPFDTEAVADAIAKALRMPLSERKRRWQHMMERLRAWDVHDWASAFVAELRDHPQHILQPAQRLQKRVGPCAFKSGGVRHAGQVPTVNRTPGTPYSGSFIARHHRLPARNTRGNQ